MSVFDTLAEQRYQEWLETVSAPGYEPPPARKTASRQSFEAHVFGEVLRHLDKAAVSDTPQEHKRHLEKARQLEVQLVILLERRRMPHATAMLRATIARRRQAVLDRASTTPSKVTPKPAT